MCVCVCDKGQASVVLICKCKGSTTKFQKSFAINTYRAVQHLGYKLFILKTCEWHVTRCCSFTSIDFERNHSHFILNDKCAWFYLSHVTFQFQPRILFLHHFVLLWCWCRCRRWFCYYCHFAICVYVCVKPHRDFSAGDANFNKNNIEIDSSNHRKNKLCNPKICYKRWKCKKFHWDWT